jgi:membrane protease YdiL (CAAX protease family)
MITSQIVRLHQQDAESWIFWDYAGRLAGLAILVAIPSAQAVAFRRDKLQLSLSNTSLWIAAIIFTSLYADRWLQRIDNAAFPMTVIGSYPRPTGWLYLIDITVGMVLVAFSEEIVFRRCARNFLQPYFGDCYGMVLASSLIFGCYHWWAGIGSMIEAFMMGILLMLFLQRSAAIWPVVLAHFLVDIAAFAW